MVCKLVAEALHIAGVVVEEIYLCQGGSPVLVQYACAEGEEILFACKSHCRVDDIKGYVSGVTYALVEDGERITERSVSKTRYELSGIIIQREVLFVCDIFQASRYVFRRDALEVEALAARENGRGKLVNLCGREDEFDMCRRLFEGLEKGVERAC